MIGFAPSGLKSLREESSAEINFPGSPGVAVAGCWSRGAVPQEPGEPRAWVGT